MGYDPNRRCMKCNRTQGYLYYCEDCHGTFCSDCIISEKTECSFCANCSHISVGNKCEICGKTNNLSAAKKYLRKCPLCSSIKIKDIPKKISGLTNEYTENINLLYKGFDMIRDFATDFSETLTQAKFLRRERFGLYPLIENNLIRIQGQFYEITQRASELIDRIFQQISQDARVLKFNQQITVNQLPTVDKILKLIKTHALSYSNLLKDFLSDSNHELSEVKELVKELNSYLTYFDEYSEKIETEMLELKIAVFDNIKVSFPDSKRAKNGILFITNKNLYFMRVHRFFFNLKGRVKAIPISIIKDIEITERKFFSSKLTINIPDKRNMKIKCSSEKLDNLRFLFRAIFNESEGYIISDPYILEELRTNLDFTLLRDKIDRRVKDLKQLPYLKVTHSSIWDRGPVVNLPKEPDKIKQLRIKLRAAQDTLKQLEKAFDERSINADIYFPRLEKAQEKIFSLEEQLKDALRSYAGMRRNNFSSNDRFSHIR